jgi:hypothetical protein
MLEEFFIRCDACALVGNFAPLVCGADQKLTMLSKKTSFL